MTQNQTINTLFQQQYITVMKADKWSNQEFTPSAKCNN